MKVELIGKVPLDTNIMVGVNFASATCSIQDSYLQAKVRTIGAYPPSGEVCIGWTTPTSLSGTSQESFYYWDKPEFHMVADWQSESYVRWCYPDILVGLIEPEIIHPNQKCSGCNKPAPHALPNQGSDFICPSCLFLKGLLV